MALSQLSEIGILRILILHELGLAPEVIPLSLATRGAQLDASPKMLT